MQKFAVFDIDGTVARTSLYLASVHAMKRRGMLAPADSDLINAKLQDWLARTDDLGFERYSTAAIDVFNRTLPTIKVTAYESVVDEVLEKFGHKIYRYTTELIKKLKKKNYLIFAVSGSEMSIVERFCMLYGFDDWIGNNYVHDGAYFTGEVGTTFKDKTKYVEQLMEKHAVGLGGSIAVGDTHGDIEMLEFVDTAVAFNPNRTLYDHAKEKGWDIVVERKNVIFELTRSDDGYRLT